MFNKYSLFMDNRLHIYNRSLELDEYIDMKN